MPHSKKSNHMVEFYRKQSDRKMIQTIINMKSQFHQHFTESIQKQQQSKTKYSKSTNKSQQPNNTFINNKKKKSMEVQTLRAKQIHMENKQIVDRLQRARQLSSNQYKKYFDFTISERLLKTRNVFRKRAKDECKSKVNNENELLMKRLLQTRSSYSLRGSQKKLDLKGRSEDKLLVYCPQQRLSKKNTLGGIDKFLGLSDNEMGLIKQRKSKKRVKTQGIQRNNSNSKQMNIDEHSIQGLDNPNNSTNKNSPTVSRNKRYTEYLDINTTDISLFPNLTATNRKQVSKSALNQYSALRTKLSSSITNPNTNKKNKQKTGLSKKQWTHGLYKILI